MRRINLASTPGRIVTAVIALAALIGAYLLMASGLERLAQARQLERLPETPIAALSEGPFVIAGAVRGDLGTFTTPYAKHPAVYVRYLLEEEYRDSDGNRRVRTLESGSRGGRFRVADPSGQVAVDPGPDLDALEWNLTRTYHRKSGRRIYSEWALRPGDTLRVTGRYHPDSGDLRFDGMAAFSLPALVSSYTLSEDSGDRLFGAAIRISIATGLLALGVALTLTTLAVHRFWVFVVVMLVAVTGTLSTLGVTRLTQEWSAIAALYETRYRHIQAQADNPLVRADVAALQQLIRQSTSGWLDRWMFRRVVEKRLPMPDLDAATQARARQIVENQPEGRYPHRLTGLALSAGSALLAALMMVLAIRAVKFKRLMEAVPTSSTQGLSFGLSEVKGLVETDDQHPFIRDPLTNQKCVAYDYKVEEKRGSGKNAKWHTIEHRAECVPFWLEDNEGKVLVRPEGADIEYPKHHSETRGNRRYSVRLLDTLVNVYCLGFAGLDPDQPDRLTLQRDSDAPFLISAREEDEIVLGRGARGFTGTAFSLGLFLFSATTLMAADGSFSPDNLLVSALMVPLLLCLYVGILHYNDIVFLKNRVDRARANIDTVLQQRHDLWPNLEKAVKAALAHEKKLMEAIARLRAAGPAAMTATRNVDQRLGFERKVTQALQARIEGYPNLKTNEVVQQFMAMMARTENYLALLRNSYTESAMIYNTRIESFPDLILARLCRFRAAPRFPGAQ